MVLALGCVIGKERAGLSLPWVRGMGFVGDLGCVTPGEPTEVTGLPSGRRVLLSACTGISYGFPWILLGFLLLCFSVQTSYHKMAMSASQCAVLAWVLTVRMKIEIVLYILAPFGIVSVSTDAGVRDPGAPEGCGF